MDRRLLSLALAVLAASTLNAADLSRLERTIAKEPSYAGKPRYCLLVFGPEAKTRIWLVHDGDNLYVDRNGDGNLTGADEKVLVKLHQGRNFPVSYRTADIGTLRDGERMHSGVEIGIEALAPDFKPVDDAERQIAERYAKTASGMVYRVNISSVTPTPPSAGKALAPRVSQLAVADRGGYLDFSAGPQEAPILHFDGPLQIRLSDPDPSLARGQEPSELNTSVGTPGVGRGSFVHLMYSWMDLAGGKVETVIPEDLYPVAEIEFPPKSTGAEPIRQRVVLQKRC